MCEAINVITPDRGGNQRNTLIGSQRLDKQGSSSMPSRRHRWQSDVINGNPLSDVIHGNQACSRGVNLTWPRGVKLWPLRERRTATAPARRGGVGQTTVARPRWRAATMASPIMQRVSPDEGGNPRQSEALRGAHENITSASSSVIKRHQASSGRGPHSGCQTLQGRARRW